MLKVSLLIQATERVTAPVRRIRSAIRGMAREGERDVGRLGRVMGRLRTIAARVGDGIVPSLRRNFDRAIALARRAGLSIARSLGRGLRNIALYGGAAALGGLGYLLYRLTVGTIQTASQFEQFQVILENTEGSARGARRAMAWVRHFAATTPYELAEVMEAFNQLRLMDFNPTTGSLEAIGNAASAMGRPLIDAIEAVQSAVTGEYEPLRRFGVMTSVAGNMLTMTYTRNGREFRTQIRNNRVEIERAMTSIFNARFPNMMRRQATTLQGLLSTISDAWTDFQLNVANAGLFDFVKGKIVQLLARINALAANGQLQTWAQQISQWLVRAGTAAAEFFDKTDWAAVGRDVRDIAQAFWGLARAVAAVAGPARTVAGLLSSINQATGVGMLQRLLSGQAPSLSVRIPLPPWMVRSPAAPGRGGRVRPGSIPGLPGPGAMPTRPRGRLRFSPSLGPPIRPQAATQRQPRAQADIHLRIDAPPSLRPTVTRLSSDSRDFTVDVRRGRAGTG